MRRKSLGIFVLVLLALVACPQPLHAQDSIGGGIFGNTGRIRNSTFANLSTPVAGNVRYCTDCTAATPCAGSGTGAFAFRVGSAWNCSSSFGGTGSTFLAANGTAGAPSFGFSSDADGTGTGLFRSAANAIGFTTNGTERWLINASGNLNPLVADTYEIGSTSVPIADVTIAAGNGTERFTPGGMIHTDVGGSGISTVTLAGGGTGYTALDILTVTQTGATGGKVRVDTVDGSGVILTFTRLASGYGYSVANNLAVTGGTGTGATFNITVLGSNITGAATTEDTLFTYDLPANTLTANGRGVRIVAWGTFAANGNTKTLRAYFTNGTVAVSNAGGFNGIPWMLIVTVLRTGASTQTAVGAFYTGTTGTWQVRVVSPAGDTTTAIPIKITGQNTTASDSDIVFTGLTLEYF